MRVCVREPASVPACKPGRAGWLYVRIGVCQYTRWHARAHAHAGVRLRWRCARIARMNALALTLVMCARCALRMHAPAPEIAMLFRMHVKKHVHALAMRARLNAGDGARACAYALVHACTRALACVDSARVSPRTRGCPHAAIADRMRYALYAPHPTGRTLVPLVLPCGSTATMCLWCLCCRGCMDVWMYRCRDVWTYVSSWMFH